MKKFFVSVLVLFFLLPAPAHASSVVTLTAPTHRHLDGIFFDDKLATELSPTGKYGTLIYNPSIYLSSWKIDPAFIEEIQAMTLGYQVSGVGPGTGKDIAIAFMDRLKKITIGSHVEAIAYANPSEYWIKKFMPHDRGYILSVSATRLDALLQQTTHAPTEYMSQKYFSLTTPQARLLGIASARIQSAASFLDSPILENYKLSEVKLLSSMLNSTQRQGLAYDLAAQVNTLRDSIRISSGKFTITSANQKLPVTITNDFPKPAVVNLNINSTNQKINVDDIKSVSVPAKSKVQVLIPITSYTSGDSGFTITLTTRDGSVFGQTITYPLKIAVISPVATWITSAAAIVLFGAAIFKSLRRIRRGKKSHEQR
jgi:Family of unknown function (DUF6049)